MKPTQHLVPIRRTIQLIVLISILCGIGCKVSRTAVTYNDKQINPLYFQVLLPNIADGSTQGCVAWKAKDFKDQVQPISENALQNKGPWFRVPFGGNGFADYALLGMYHKESVVLFRESDGSMTRAYILFLKLSEQRSCLKRYAEIKNLKDDMISLQGDTLHIGARAIAVSTLKQID